ncbi:hypothetical protein [Desulfocurvibacter africanus]|uniref:hypothetical protein n=1 Tax=Desulfocurvibacter africanus TaxID=873 RepID=UPI0004299002|nr:hypothetical protein [Desulfocurvibacter africanus]
MTEAEIIRRVRKGIREPSPRLVSDEDIREVITEAVRSLALEMMFIDRRYFTRARVVSSNTHVFVFPADAQSILRVWAMQEKARAVAGANGEGEPITLTIPGHGFTDNETVEVQDVGGNTAANGTWQVENATADTFGLRGAVGNAAYTVGGKAFRSPKRIDLLPVAHIEDTTATGRWRWYPRGDAIVLDANQFAHDLYVEYLPTVESLALTDIPGLYHPGIAGYCVSELLVIPAQDDPAYADLSASYSRNAEVWNRALETLRTHFRPAPQPNMPRDVMGWGAV